MENDNSKYWQLSHEMKNNISATTTTRLHFSIILEVLANVIRQGKKCIHTGRWEIKLSLFARHMVVHKEYPREREKTVRINKWI